MSQEEKVDPQYLKQFNNGYLLAKHEPGLAAQVMQSTNGLEGKGLKEGIEQYNSEKKKDLNPSWLKKDRLSSPDKMDKGDKDKIDLDRE